MHDDYLTYFETFAEISKSIHSGISTGEILENITASITEITGAKGCIFWIINLESRKIETMISHGFAYRSLEMVSYETLTRIFDPSNPEKVFIEDARNDERIPDLERLGKKRVGSISGLFFDIEPPLMGIVAVYFTQSRKLSENELKLVNALGEQGAISLHKALHYNAKILQAFRQFVEGFVLTIEAKDESTHGHSMRVADFAKMAAIAMNLPEKEVETIYRGALLHDIGKIGIEDYILSRLGALSKKEMAILKRHPVIGSKIIKPLSFLKEVEPLILLPP